MKLESLGQAKESSPEKVSDAELARLFWLWKPESVVNVVRQKMERDIKDALERGLLRVVVSQEGVVNGDKERLAAFRVLAGELGYHVGEFVLFNKGEAVAPIEKEKSEETSVAA